ncbi:MAG TPA: alpha/beta fold hydrolase [Azospirillaceae bacterium]|nr:alpha/beta fold hydrolase [Azospirillaceae bacterium]
MAQPPLTPPVRTVEVAGRTIRYAAEGRGAETVVFIHGYGGDRLSWMLVQPRIAETARTFAPDLPGHGGSTKDVGPGTLSFFADTVRGFLDAVAAGPVHVVGHSMGGAVALAFAEAAPQRVRSLTLVAPAAFGTPANKPFVEDFIALDRPEQVPPLMARILADTRMISSQVVDLVLAYKRTPGVPEALRTIADALFEPDGTARHDFRPLLAGLRCPVEVVWGDADGIVPVAAADGLPAQVGVSRIPGVGHAPHLERPAMVVQAVRRAIARAA